MPHIAWKFCHSGEEAATVDESVCVRVFGGLTVVPNSISPKAARYRGPYLNMWSKSSIRIRQ